MRLQFSCSSLFIPLPPLTSCSRYADHIGIHYVLCSKLRQFPYEDIEFFLPQLCHLIISVDNESMALEEFLLDLCEESVTAALLVRRPLPPCRPAPPPLTPAANALPADVLAVPDLPPRPLPDAADRGVQDLPQGIQQGAARGFWAF